MEVNKKTIIGTSYKLTPFEIKKRKEKIARIKSTDKNSLNSISKRREKNKIAKQSRKVNRK